jgi:hypothetical protein
MNLAQEIHYFLYGERCVRIDFDIVAVLLHQGNVRSVVYNYSGTGLKVQLMMNFGTGPL